MVLYMQMTLLAVVVAANCEPWSWPGAWALGGVAVVALSIYAFEKTMWGSSYPIEGGVTFTGVGTNENILAYTLAISLAAILAAGRPRHGRPRSLWLAVLAVNALRPLPRQLGHRLLSRVRARRCYRLDPAVAGDSQGRQARRCASGSSP